MRAEDYTDLYALEQDYWWFVGMREIAAALLDPVCAPAPEGRLVLDAGCGTGGNLTWLERYAGRGRVVGLDLAPDALRLCRERGGVDLAQASVAALPFADSAFDLVTSFDVLVQLPGEGADERAVREMYRVLRPGGVAFIRVAAYRWMWSGHDEALGTQRRYTVGELVGMTERAGFETLRATYANSLLLPAAAVRRLLLKRLGLAGSGSDVTPLPAGLRPLNYVLTTLLRVEASVLRRARARLPFGLSAICVAKKPSH